MHATTMTAPSRNVSLATTPRFLTVGGRECVVRVTPVSPISEVLEFEDEFEASEPVDARMVMDLLDSRMIAPPRPRRRRDRAVSSRAIFYSAGQ
jgi:hypothetical protein